MSTAESSTPGAERQPVSRRRDRARRVLHLLILSCAAVMLVDAIVGEQGVVALGQARREFAAITGHVRQLRAENELMRERNRRLREDRAAQEEAARRDLGLMKPGEKVFIIKDLPSPSQP